MSSPFIKRSKPRPSLRQRSPNSTSSPLAGPAIVADEDAAEVGSGISPMALMASKRKEKEKRRVGAGMTSGSGGKTRLSFGGEEEEMDDESTPFKPRKSQLSQSISLQKLALSSTSASAGASPSTSYSADYLQSLKASTPTRGSSSRSANDMEVDDPDEMENGFSHAAREKYGDQGLEVEDTTAGIPDEAFVAAAKAKRKAKVGMSSADEQAGGEDYISLEDGRGRVAVYDGDKGPHPESRLVREDDEEGEGDEDLADYTEANASLHLGKKANKAAARRLKTDILEMIDDKENEEIDDEDGQEWENAQAGRAGAREEKFAKIPEVRKGYKPAFTPLARPLPTVSASSSRLATSLALMESSLINRNAKIEANQRELATLEEQEVDLRREVGRVEGKREWLAEFSGWVEMLGGFLEEKFPLLEDIEADTLHHYKERAQMVGKRRKDDDLDDLALFLGVPVDQFPHEEIEVDELGREKRKVDESGPQSGTRRHRRQDRESRRSRRRAARPATEEDGFSTDSTLGPSDAADYSAAQTTLTSRIKALASDVKAEEFKDPEVGLSKRFKGWRDEDAEGYTNCYAGASMVQGWEYWARVEMVGWEPSRHLVEPHSFRWYQALHDYSHLKPDLSNGDVDMDADDELELGPEGDLAHAMVLSAVAPLITKVVEAGGYDLYSKRQTGRLTEQVFSIEEIAGRESPKFKAMLKAILTAFLREIECISSLVESATRPNSTPPPSFDPASRTALTSFINRQIKLLRNILAWRRAAKEEVVQLVNKLVGEVIVVCLRRCWDSGGSELGPKVIQAAGASTLSPHTQQSLSGNSVRMR